MRKALLVHRLGKGKSMATGRFAQRMAHSANSCPVANTCRGTRLRLPAAVNTTSAPCCQNRAASTETLRRIGGLIGNLRMMDPVKASNCSDLISTTVTVGIMSCDHHGNVRSDHHTTIGSDRHGNIGTDHHELMGSDITGIIHSVNHELVGSVITGNQSQRQAGCRQSKGATAGIAVCIVCILAGPLSAKRSYSPVWCL